MPFPNLHLSRCPIPIGILFLANFLAILMLDNFPFVPSLSWAQPSRRE